MDSDYEQIVEAILASEDFENEQLSIEDLPVTSEGDDAVRIDSIADPKHVNALESVQPLTFALDGITIIYGDNATGKSGFARLLKRIARARHQEEILSDVFRDTGQDEPSVMFRLKCM